MYYKFIKRSYCFDWKTPSRAKFVIAERFESFSHFRTEKSDSIDVVFAKAVANPPANNRRYLSCPRISSQASLNFVDGLCLLIVLLSQDSGQLKIANFD